MNVPFVQFMRLNGRQVETAIELPDDLAGKVAEIQAAGCRFTSEMLMTDTCSFCIEYPPLGDFDIALSPNGQQIPLKIAEMIRSFDTDTFNRWKHGMENGYA
jgi:hypothetical protein